MTDPATAAIAVDVGQTGCRAARITPDGGLGNTAETAGFVYRPDTDPVAQMTDLIDTVVAELSLSSMETVAVGTTGFPPAGSDRRRLADTLAERTGARRVLAAADLVTAHLGALGGDRGVCLVAGTGSVAFAVGDAGRARADGWGYLLGDEGSGFWLGRAGLAAALRAVDGRPNGSPALLDAATAAFDTEAAYLSQAVHTSARPVARIAGFAPAVLDVARDGDEPARRLVRQAADALAETTATALEQAFDPDTDAVAVTWAGRLLTARSELREAFRGALEHRCPRARPTDPQGGCLHGAAHLAVHGVPDVLASVVVDRRRSQP